MIKDKRYWDSCVFLAYLNKERDRSQICQAILDAADAGKIQIFTSALTIAEVLKYKGKKPIKKESRQMIIEFFQNDYIKIINVDRLVATEAQELVWEHNIPPKDAIHVASAIRAKLPVIETYDNDDLISKTGSVGSPPILIREPADIQLGLFETGEEKEEPD